MLSQNVIVTSNITNFKCKYLPTPQGTTSTGRVQTKIIFSAIRHSVGKYSCKKLWAPHLHFSNSNSNAFPLIIILQNMQKLQV